MPHEIRHVERLSVRIAASIIKKHGIHDGSTNWTGLTPKQVAEASLEIVAHILAGVKAGKKS